MMLIPIAMLGFFGGWNIYDSIANSDAQSGMIGFLSIALGAVLTLLEVD